MFGVGGLAVGVNVPSVVGVFSGDERLKPSEATAPSVPGAPPQLVVGSKPAKNVADTASTCEAGTSVATG